MWAIPDAPGWVVRARARREFIAEKRDKQKLAELQELQEREDAQAAPNP